MNFGPEYVMWENSVGTAYATGNGAHQWFDKNNGFLGGGSAASTILDATATNGVWTKVDMESFDYLRIWGVIVCTEAGSWTGARAGIMPYAFMRNIPLLNTTALADEILGVDLLNANGNATAGGTRLTSSAVHFAASGETDNIRATQDWSNAVRIHSGLAATETQPIAKFSSLATGTVRYWWYDIGHAYDLNTTSPYTQTILPGQPLQNLSGCKTVYVALKALNEGAWVGSGDFELGGKIWAQPWREGLSMTARG